MKFDYQIWLDYFIKLRLLDDKLSKYIIFTKKTFAVVSIFFIIASTSNLVLSTLLYHEIELPVNITGLSNASTGIIDIGFHYSIFEWIEGIYIGWFTFEFVLRFMACPDKLKFSQDPLNIIDLISIAPFYFSMALYSVPKNILVHTKTVRHMFTIFRVLRILRIFKLARHSESLQSLGRTVSMSLNEFGILFMFLAIAVLLFSNLIYFAEKDEVNTLFTSIPATFW